jgi:hypothetical protein
MAQGGPTASQLATNMGAWPGLGGLEFVDLEPARGCRFNDSPESRETGRPGSGFWYLGPGVVFSFPLAALHRSIVLHSEVLKK